MDSPVASVVAISAIVTSPGVVEVGAEMRRAGLGRGDVDKTEGSEAGGTIHGPAWSR